MYYCGFSANDSEEDWSSLGINRPRRYSEGFPGALLTPRNVLIEETPVARSQITRIRGIRDYVNAEAAFIRYANWNLRYYVANASIWVCECDGINENAITLIVPRWPSDRCATLPPMPFLTFMQRTRFCSVRDMTRGTSRRSSSTGDWLYILYASSLRARAMNSLDRGSLSLDDDNFSDIFLERRNAARLSNFEHK